MTYTYDDWGNIQNKKIYAYTTAENPGTPTQTIPYTYSTEEWKDQLVSYNGQSIGYDAMGNPETYRGKTLIWRGKQLTGVSGGAHNYSYIYDTNGLRQQKTEHHTDPNDDIQTYYYYNGSILIGLKKVNDTLRFSYDAGGQVQAVDFNGTYYYYINKEIAAKKMEYENMMKNLSSGIVPKSIMKDMMQRMENLQKDN